MSATPKTARPHHPRWLGLCSGVQCQCHLAGVQAWLWWSARRIPQHADPPERSGSRWGGPAVGAGRLPNWPG